MADLHPSIPEILTSGSAYATWLACQRRRWLGYEAPNGGDGPVRGWQRQSLAVAPTTGSYCHKVVEALLRGTDASEAILGAKEGYLAEAADRTLDVELADSGEWATEEQVALVEAFGWAFVRVRLPQLLSEYEPIAVEREELTLLSGDVGLASRTDAVLRRRSDGMCFVYNLKTTSSADARWKAQWLVDQQLMTETLAVERRLGERVWGVIIDGFVKGPRVECDKVTLKEVRGAGDEDRPRVYCQRNRLLYGYKTEANPPVQLAMYDWEGTTRKGWFKFAVWRNEAFGDNPLAYWVNWIPEEVVASCFHTMEPIMRDERAVESFVGQMVAGERRIRSDRRVVDGHNGNNNYLDDLFPQNLHACVYPSKCWAYALCHEPGALEHPEDFGYVPRQANHPLEEGGE